MVPPALLVIGIAIIFGVTVHDTYRPSAARTFERLAKMALLILGGGLAVFARVRGPVPLGHVFATLALIALGIGLVGACGMIARRRAREGLPLPKDLYQRAMVAGLVSALFFGGASLLIRG